MAHAFVGAPPVSAECSSSRRPRRLVSARVALAPPPASPAALEAADIPRGETAGAVLIVDKVSLQAGERDLIVDADWRVMPGQRVGLTGANGAGKSTLLKCLCGLRKVDGGRLLLGPHVSLGYLEQTAVSGSDRTVWEEARSRMTHLIAAEAALESALKRLEAGEAKAADALASAEAAYASAGGFDADKRIANVLTGLGFKQPDWVRPASAFSGGWQMRLALARLLLGPAGQSAADGGNDGLLLLDEPTNHLDAASSAWLANFLATSSGTCVIVSHDERLLEAACDRITEVRGGTLHHYTGSYASFMEQRKQREEQAMAAASAEQEEIARLEAFVARFGANASKASQAKSREKVLIKMKEAATEAPAPASGAGPGDKSKASLRLPPPPACHREIIKLEGAAVGWGGTPLIKNITVTVEKGQRVLVLGPNGAGKSTLLKSLAGESPLLGGRRKLGEGAKVAFFSQDLAQDLPLDSPALDYVLAKARQDDAGITMEEGRRSLGSLGLVGEMASRKIGELSGGEKARVALAAFALIPYNCLLMDEPSNHLDVGTIAVLSSALQRYAGAIVAVTHNQTFAAGLNATHVLRVANGSATMGPCFGLSAADFAHDGPGGGGGGKGRGGSGGVAGGGLGAGVPRKTPPKKKEPTEEERAEAAREAARAERFALAGNDMAAADARPKSKLERQAAQREAEAKAKQAKVDAKKRGFR